jgi:hypothetical protein
MAGLGGAPNGLVARLALGLEPVPRSDQAFREPAAGAALTRRPKRGLGAEELRMLSRDQQPGFDVM